MLDSCLTEPEKTALKTKWNKQSNESKKRKRKKQREEAANEVKPPPTAKNLRQQLLRQKKKEEKEMEQAFAEAPTEETAEGTIANLRWENAYIQIQDVEPVYQDGHVIKCPDKLKGEHAMAAMMLLGVTHYLQEKWDSEEVTEVFQLAATGDAKITGVREISGNRYEFFIQVQDCTLAAFCTILQYSEKMRRKDPNLFLDEGDMVKLVGMIVAFGTQRAHVRLDEKKYELQNFALLVSRDETPAQDVHIDVCEKEQFQLGMLCSPRGELTSEYQCGEDETVEIGGNLTSWWTDLPPSLQTKLDNIPNVQKLLDGFGPLLSPTIKKTGDEEQMPIMVPFGSMLCLPGRVMHCGPAVSEKNMVRAVMFFTATPKGNTAIAYNADTQYCRTTIIGDILFYTWPSLDPEEKKYMLRKWVEVGLSKDSAGAIEGNMQHRHLKVIALALRNMAESEDTEPEDMDNLIDKIAKDKKWTNANRVRYWELSRTPYMIPK
jgi:hypothetical protein